MEIKISITPKLETLMQRLRGDIDGGLKAGMINLVETIEAGAVKKAPVDTSHLVNSISSYVTNNGQQGVVKATAKYAAFVHFGTGIYGPRKQLITIVPKKKKALSWFGAKHPVKKVVQKGHRPNPFLYDAVKKIDPGSVYEKGVGNYLRKKGW